MRHFGCFQLLKILQILLHLFLRKASSQPPTNHYDTLGISPTASLSDIKAAYRQKALETHPDKRQDISPEEAASQFQEVVMAFEILTDEKLRRAYDLRHHHHQQQRPPPRYRYASFFTSNKEYIPFHERRRQRTQAAREDQLRRSSEVQQAKARVIQLASLSQLESILLNDDGTLERNMLLCVITKNTESKAQEQLLFPYPFAGWSTIWWDDILQTLLVRYPLEDNLRRLLRLPSDSDSVQEPLLFFGNRGSPLHFDHLDHLYTSDRSHFQSWIWDRFSVNLTFVNHHQHPVQVFWINEKIGQLAATLQPGDMHTEETRISHEWKIRDIRVDSVVVDSAAKLRMPPETVVATYRVESDALEQRFEIPNRPCLDLTSLCRGWKEQGECQANPGFMHEYCAFTCDVCEDFDSGRKEKARLEEESNNNRHGEL